jgi:hypothetical protein
VAKIDEGELLVLLKDRYDYSEGSFYNKRTLNSRALKGKKAGSKHPPRRPGDGISWRIRIQGKQYLTAHLVWLWHHGHLPKADIKHLDGDKLNTTTENLCEYDHRQCPHKRREDTRNYPGVYWCARTGKWRVQIWVDKQAIHLGRFAELEDAIAARKAAEKEHKSGFN